MLEDNLLLLPLKAPEEAENCVHHSGLLCHMQEKPQVKPVEDNWEFIGPHNWEAGGGHLASGVTGSRNLDASRKLVLSISGPVCPSHHLPSQAALRVGARGMCASSFPTAMNKNSFAFQIDSSYWHPRANPQRPRLGFMPGPEPVTVTESATRSCSECGSQNGAVRSPR